MYQKQKIVILLLPVIFGGIIYIVFRSDQLLMFSWLGSINEIRTLNNFGNTVHVLHWFKYSLPDGLWLLSYTALMLEIWNHRISKQSLFWIFSLPCIALFSEFLQLFKVIPGTFDFIDLIFYSLGTALPFYKSNVLIFNTNNHEKI
jgi:hypothetical protein